AVRRGSDGRRMPAQDHRPKETRYDRLPRPRESRRSTGAAYDDLSAHEASEEASDEASEEDVRHHAEQGNQDRERPERVAEEAGHPHVVLLGDRLDDEVRAVPDVGDCAHEDGAAGDGSEEVLAGGMEG